MAILRVFVSSTCYDLKYIRENLKYFINTLGYEPVLSEEGSVYYDPNLDTQDSCLREIPSCQMFVLIIGGRFGEAYKDTGDSITNNEYREAVKSKIPVFALVDSSVLTEFTLYQKNKANKKINEKEIDYASADSPKIFDFVEEVRTNSVNNALVPFSNFSGIESYLKQQWSGMMYSFLTRQNEESRVADTLSALTQISEKVEFISTEILKSIGTDEAKIMSELYDLVMGSQILSELRFFDLKPTPKDILRNETFKDLTASLGREIGVVVKGDFAMSKRLDGKQYKYRIKRFRYEEVSNGYLKLHNKMLEILSKYNITLEKFLGHEGS